MPRSQLNLSTKSMTKKIENLARAIVEFEGWLPGRYTPRVSEAASVSYRNHNPGNLRTSPFSLGERDEFAYFLNDDVGFFALMWDLWKKAKGETSTVLNGEASLALLIEVYSNETGEILENYIRFAIQKTGMTRDTKLKELLKFNA